MRFEKTTALGAVIDDLVDVETRTTRRSETGKPGLHGKFQFKPGCLGAWRVNRSVTSQDQKGVHLSRREAEHQDYCARNVRL